LNHNNSWLFLDSMSYDMFSVMFHVMIITADIIMIIVLVFQMIIGVHNWMMMTAIVSIVAGVVVELFLIVLLFLTSRLYPRGFLFES
jgi:hypothetical protein